MEFFHIFSPKISIISKESNSNITVKTNHILIAFSEVGLNI